MTGGRRVALAAVLAGLAGCAQMPLQEPMLAVSHNFCAAKPDFATAIPVGVDDREGASATLGSAGQCLVLPNGRRTTYAVFALPPAAPAYTIEILSVVVPRAIVRPLAMLFDGAGQVIRTVPPEEFEPNITGLRAGVRPQETARFLVVEADQARLGQELTLRLSDAGPPVLVASAVPIFILPPIPPSYPDVTRRRTAVFALNGRITVILAPQRTMRTSMASNPASSAVRSPPARRYPGSNRPS